MESSNFALAVEPDLVQRLRQGETPARATVFRTFEQPVFTLALRLLRDEQEALDALQDTFVQVFARIDQFRDDAPFWGWLRQIAVNTCLGRLRRRKRHLALLPAPGDVVTDHADERLDLVDALGCLPPETRAVVWLYDVEGYTHPEIARLFGRSVSFSKTQLSRAHARLRDLLDRDEGGDLCPQTAPI